MNKTIVQMDIKRVQMDITDKVGFKPCNKSRCPALYVNRWERILLKR